MWQMIGQNEGSPGRGVEFGPEEKNFGPRSVITTDEVLTEFLAYCSSHPNLRREAGLAVLHLQNDVERGADQRPALRARGLSRDIPGVIKSATPTRAQSLPSVIFTGVLHTRPSVAGQIPMVLNFADSDKWLTGSSGFGPQARLP